MVDLEWALARLFRFRPLIGVRTLGIGGTRITSSREFCGASLQGSEMRFRGYGERLMFSSIFILIINKSAEAIPMACDIVITNQGPFILGDGSAFTLTCATLVAPSSDTMVWNPSHLPNLI